MKTSRRLLGALGASLVGLLLSSPALHAATKGADVGYLPQMEANGYTWNDKNGVQRDVLSILKDYQIDSIRLRTWVNPSSDSHSGHCSQAETIDMAVRCKNAGYRIMIDFHYGDTWNSVGKQNPPAAWASMSYTQMKSALSSYVTGFCNALKAAGVTPEWIQNGNETNSGICRPTGSVSNPAQMTGLFLAGYDAIKAVFPNCKVIMHIAGPQNSDGQTMLDAYKANGGKWDITGCSSYASLGNQPGVQNAVLNLGTRYDKPVMMVEVGGPVSKPSETKQVVEKWLAGVPNGVFYWEPERYAPWTDGSSNLNGTWDSTTKRPTIAMDGFITATTGTTYGAESAAAAGGVTIDTNQTGYNGTGFANFPTTGGSLTFNNVGGNGGGTKSLAIRYANGNTAARTGTITVNNGTVANITFPSTGGWATWSTLNVNITLNNNSTNSIKFASTGADLGNIDEIVVP